MVPFVSKHVENGAFKPEPVHEQAVKPMLDELHRWATALAPMRAS
jgi:hypothetical protein